MNASTKALTCIITVILTISILGCSKTVKNESVATPSQLLEQLRISLVNKNEPLFLQCFKDSDSHHNFLHQTYRRVQAVIQFRDEVEKNYGEGAWKEYQESGQTLATQPKLIEKIIPLSKEWWQGLQIEKQENKAFFFDPFTQMTNTMSKVNGEWKIDVKSMISQDADENKLASFLKITTDAIEEFTKEIPIKKPPIGEIGIQLYQKVSEKMD